MSQSPLLSNMFNVPVPNLDDCDQLLADLSGGHLPPMVFKVPPNAPQKPKFKFNRNGDTFQNPRPFSNF